MKIPRTERIARIMWRLTKNPFRSFSLSDIAKGFKVSKTVISDDIEIISKAMKMKVAAILSSTEEEVAEPTWFRF